MSKRRVFDINFPSEPPAPKAAAVPAGTDLSPVAEPRRGPMATAISENADALRVRADAEQKIRAENDRLAHEFVRLKKLGLMVDRIPLEQIETTKLTRDRSLTRDVDLDELITSIRSLGLSNPIRVEQGGDGYQLVQGFRRLMAYRALFEETGDALYATIPAGLVAQGETLQGLYRRMVDENLVRRDISFAEMAQLALSYMQDDATEVTTLEQAISTLYASTGRQKRNYVRHFAELLEWLGEDLQFAEMIPRALGLDLKKRLGDDRDQQAALRRALQEEQVQTAEQELAILRAALDRPVPRAARSPVRSAARVDSAKTTLRCTVPAGTVRCLARNGRIEMAMEKDFSTIDQRRLESAIAAFFEALDTAPEDDA
ncbi:MAG: ParB N-terminal domain-containing protein [Rhodobacteraceae bacterium]|nr:ParB N-terminal domain-containing protein [Paracoccaceae bacterium]